MKRVLAVLMILLTLTGCTGRRGDLDRALGLRDGLLKGNGCAFETVITADYGDKIYSFRMNCRADSTGIVEFEVMHPETIAGISGTLSNEGGKLTFDDQALMFEMLTDGQITPVSAPWLFVHTLRSGYIKACGNDGNGLYIQIDDSYNEDALHLDVFTNENDMPIRVELLWQGRRIVSMDVENFTIL